MKAVKKDVFDINKVTVVGSPTITSDGVASGFSDSNYLRGATGITLGDNFKIRVKFTTGDDVTSYQGILRMQSTTGFLCSISNRTNSPRLVLSIPDKSDISVIPVMKTNTEYKILIECQNGLLTTYYSENNSNLTKVSEVENVNITLTNTFLALGNNTNLYFWQGSINLPSISITVDGELVYSPTRPTTFLERRKEGFDLSKFTVVGSPTITEDGVYTCGYDEASYVKVPFDNNLDSFSLDIEINILDRSQTGYYLGHSNNISYGFMDAYFNGVGITDFRIRVKDDDGNVSTLAMGASNYRVGTEKINLTFTGTQYILTRTRADGVVYTKTVDSTFKPATNFFSLGCGKEESVPYPTINLTKITNTVDGKEVFTGAKEKFYAIGDF